MGLYYHFYIQQQTDDGWIVPVGFKNNLQGFRENLGQFSCFKHSPMFTGESALLPLHRARPPEIEESSLYQQLRSAFDERYFGWIGFEELLLDAWGETFVYVSTHVPASLAHLFGDGAQLFPENELLEHGSTVEEIAAYRDDSFKDILEKPIDCRRYSRDFPGWVEVSWKISVEDFLGECWVNEFKDVRRFGSDSELRIICTRS